PSPAAGPWPACQQADEASAAGPGGRPTKPMPERLPESSRYPTTRVRHGSEAVHVNTRQSRKSWRTPGRAATVRERWLNAWPANAPLRSRLGWGFTFVHFYVAHPPTTTNSKLRPGSGSGSAIRMTGRFRHPRANIGPPLRWVIVGH